MLTGAQYQGLVEQSGWMVMSVLTEIAAMREGAKLIQTLLRRGLCAGIDATEATQQALAVADVMAVFDDFTRPERCAAFLRALRQTYPELCDGLPHAYGWLAAYESGQIASTPRPLRLS